MLDEVTTLNFDDVVIANEELHELVMCTNNEVIRFCDYYGVNIWTFVDIAFSKSTH